MNFKNILKLPFYELLPPGVMAVRDVSSGKTLILSGNSLVSVLTRTIKEFNEGSFNHRELQQRFTEGNVELLFVSTFDIPEGTSPSISPIIGRIRAKEQYDLLVSAGIPMYEIKNVPKIKAKVIIRRGFYPQVILRSANNSKLYIQKLFKTVAEAEDYVKSTDLIQMLLDSKGISKFYKPPGELALSSRQAVESNAVTQTAIENEEENTKV